jgi:hypothetical protein
MITHDERYPAMKTVADWNWWFGMHGTQPYTIIGLVTQTNTTYCANCASHVEVFDLDKDARFIFDYNKRFCGVCHGCYVSICNCKIED